MPYKSRGIYKEEGKVRDYNLFVIVAEGSKREVEYLVPFDMNRTWTNNQTNTCQIRLCQFTYQTEIISAILQKLPT